MEKERFLAALNYFRSGHLSPPIIFGMEMSVSEALNHPAGPGAAWKHDSIQAEQFLLTVQILPSLHDTVLSHFLGAGTKEVVLH